MSTVSNVYCPQCGSSNPPIAQYCAVCGRPLAIPRPGYGAPPAVVPQKGTVDPFYRFKDSYYATEQHRSVDRTKTGLLVIAIGFLFAWIPLLGFIGDFFEFAGAIIVILGRNSFGQTHARNVIWAMIISVIALAAGFGIGVIIGLSEVAASLGINFLTNPRTFSGEIYVSEVVVTAIFGVAEVLLTYALQNKNGRILLWSAYATSNAMSVLSLLLSSSFQYLGNLLQITPSILFAYAYYSARTRIVHGDISPHS